MGFIETKKISLDPRTKLLLILLGNILLFSYGDQIYLFISTFYGILLMVLLGKFKDAFNFSLSCLFIYLLTYLFSFGPKELYSLWEIIVLPIVLFLPVVALGFLLFTTTGISEMISALQKMYFPNFIITPLVIMFRFFPTLKEELGAISDAMKLKGLKKNPLKVLEYIYVPILFNSIRISEDLNISGLTRGLGLYNSSTHIAKIKFGVLDLFSILFFIILILLRKQIIVL